MNNYYNEEESKHRKLIEDLKKLPRVKTPDDFEFNLMTRIQNKNFGDVTESKPNFSLIKFLAPSAVVVAAVLLFFVFYPKSSELQNTNSIQPPATAGSPASTPAKTETTIKELALTEPAKKPVEKMFAKRNDAVGNNAQPPRQDNSRNIDELIHNQNSISLDDYISGDYSNQKNLQRGNVVTSEDHVPDFDGFFVKQKTDAATLKRYREVVDSLKKAQLKLDSLKKASKLP